MDATVCKKVEPRTGTITLTGHGPERLWKLYAAGLVAEEARSDTKETLTRYNEMRCTLTLSEARRRDQNAVLRKYQAQRLQGYLDESLRDRQRLRRRALRKDPGVRDVAFGFCALGIALGASVITMVAAFML